VTRAASCLGFFASVTTSAALAVCPTVGCSSTREPERPAPRAAAAKATAAPAPPVPVFVEEDDADVAPAAHPDTVTLRLVADGKRKAQVFWGRKLLGIAPLEIKRPRRSGPLDLLIVAPGSLPLHTRVFTDRDETLVLRLHGEKEAPGLLGYRRDGREGGAPPLPSQTLPR